MSQRPEPDPFSLIDISRRNPWWEDEAALPARAPPRTDLYWRVRNTLEHDVVLIPGAPVTGTNTTLKQVIRALLLGAEHEEQRIQDLFRSDVGPVDEEGCKPAQICYATCSDPLAYLVEEYVDEVRRAYHPRGAQTGELDFYLFVADVHRLDGWRDQLSETHGMLSEEFPEEWTLVATVPVARLAHETDFERGDAVRVDQPHHTQKFRDTLFAHTPALRDDLRPVEGEDTQLDRTRAVLRDAAVGEATSEALETPFKDLKRRIRDYWSEDELRDSIDQYLTVGGFAPAIAGSNGDEADASRSRDAASQGPGVAAVQTHITSGVATTLYQDIPRLAKTEPDIPRIDNPEELHALIAFLARREFAETTYIGLGEFLGCDTRTIRQKYVPILEDLHIGERATRYDLERDRTVRFYLRSPGYLTAFRERPVSAADRMDRLRVTLADHLRRLLAKFEGNDGLQYWRDEPHLVDYIGTVDTHPVLFVSEFVADGGGGVDACAAFADAVETPHLEVVIAESDAEVAVQRLDTNRLRLSLPHWLLLTVC